MAFKMFVSESKPKVERTPRESRPHCHFTTTNGVGLISLVPGRYIGAYAGIPQSFQFTVTNSTVAATDTIVVSCKSSTTNKYLVFVTAVAAGSFELTFNTTGGTTSDSPVFNFAVIKAVAA